MQRISTIKRKISFILTTRWRLNMLISAYSRGMRYAYVWGDNEDIKKPDMMYWAKFACIQLPLSPSEALASQSCSSHPIIIIILLPTQHPLPNDEWHSSTIFNLCSLLSLYKRASHLVLSISLTRSIHHSFGPHLPRGNLVKQATRKRCLTAKPEVHS